MFQDTSTNFGDPNRFFDEHFNKYHPKGVITKANIPHINVYEEQGLKHYQKPFNHKQSNDYHRKKPKDYPQKNPHSHHQQQYPVSSFQPEFFKQFYDETEKHFLHFNTNKSGLHQKRNIIKNKDPKKFHFPSFETF